MIKYILLVATALVYSQVTFAEYSAMKVPEYFWQTPTGNVSVVPTFAYLNFSGSNFSSKTYLYEVAANYGVNDLLALGLKEYYASGYANTGGTTEYQSFGLGDLELDAIGHVDLNGAQFFYGLALRDSLSQDVSGNNSSNQQSGGFTAAPYIGVGTAVTPNLNIGGQLTLALKGDRKAHNPDSNIDTTYKNGNTFTADAYGEIKSANSIYGLNIEYFSQADSGATSSSGSTFTSVGYSGPTFALYMSYYFSQNLILAPRLGYGFYNFNSQTNTASTSVNPWVAQVSLRYLF